MKHSLKITLSLFCFYIVGLIILQPVRQMGQATKSVSTPTDLLANGEDVPRTVNGIYVSEPVVPSLSPAVRDLPPYKPEDVLLNREINPRFHFNSFDPSLRISGGIDPLVAVQASAPAPSAFPFMTPIFNIPGQGYSGVQPPDTVGDVGPNHYIQMINDSGGTLVQIYNKDGSSAAPSFSLDSLATGGGNQCSNGLGDPIALYDRLADRWMLSEFSSSGNRLCIYISQTPDPTGAWYDYNFTAVNSFPDYPKYGVWPDAYYAGTNESSPTLYAFDRANMLAGNPATLQSFNASSLSGFGFQILTPSDLDGASAPPSGSPNYFMRHRDTEAHGAGSCPNPASNDCLEIFAFSVDWITPANSNVTQVGTIPVADFDSDLCGFSTFSCINSTGTALDPLREVVMWRLQYRNFGSHETLVGNLTTDADGTDRAAVRWFELRKSTSAPTAWSLYQEGTYDLADGLSRWMGSAAMDGSGNLAIGYSVTSGSVAPGIRYAGRLSTDPLGTLPQGEGTITNGSGAHSGERWGDYSSLNVDPADDCTFWYTTEYMNGGSTWATQIASFKFDSCSGSLGSSFTMDTAPTTQAVCAGTDALYDVTVTGLVGFGGAVDLVAVGNPGVASFSPDPITPDGVSVLTISGTGAGTYTFDIIGTSVLTSSIVQTNTISLDVAPGIPGTPALVSPSNGSTGIATSPTFTWNPIADAISYNIDIATDPAFSAIVDSANVAGTSYATGVSLNPTTTYYWRVHANNGCGSGSYATAFSFTTANVVCTIYPSGDVPQTIGPNAGTNAVSTLNIADSGTILDVNILNLAGTHTWMGDLDFNLISPAGTAPIMMNTGSCGSAQNFDTNLDDEASAAFPCPPTGGGTYLPTTALSAFDGEDLNGTWTLRVDDNADADGGQLNSWSLEICYNPPPPPDPDFAVMTTPATLDVCQPSDGVFTVDITTINGYVDPVTLSMTGEPVGTTVNFSPNIVNPAPGSSMLTMGNTEAATAGSYTLDIAGTGSVGTRNDTVQLNILDLPTSPTLSFPADGSTGISTTPTFDWTAVTGATSYFIEIATDSGFGTIVDSATVGTNSYTPATLSANTTYYWQVQASNTCGSSLASSTFSFTTENVTCTIYPSSDIPQTIPNNGTATSIINVVGSGSIVDVNVLNLQGTHGRVGQLTMFLDSPTLTTVQLRDQACGTDNDFNINYDDDAGALTAPCPPTDGGTYQPFGLLSDFNGEDSVGTWTLRVVDNATPTTGQLNSWSLEICTAPLAPDFNVDVTPVSLDVCQPDDGVFTVDVLSFNGFVDPVTLSLSGEPAGTTVNFSPNPVNPTPSISTLTIGNTGAATTGSYPLTVTGVGITSTHTDTVTLNILAGAPGSTTLTSPTDGATGVATNPIFIWTTVTGATSYDIEIATDPSFATIVDSATVATNSYSGATLLNGTTYYWRVTPNNSCGVGTASSVFNFTTLSGPTVYCSVPGLAIPDGDSVGTTDTIVVSTVDGILDLDVAITTTHTYVGDLIFRLQHVDTGTTITLIDRPGVPAISSFGCSGDNIDAILDDEAATLVEDECAGAVPTIDGSFIPNQALAGFDGENISGTWILTVSDNEAADTGTLEEWCLIPALGDPPPNIVVDPISMSSSQPADVTVNQTLTISNRGGQDLIWSIQEEPRVFTSYPSFMSMEPTASNRAQVLGPEGIAQLERDFRATVTVDQATGVANFVRFAEGVNFGRAGISIEEQAMAFFADYGHVFGIQNARTELTLLDTIVDEYGFTHLEYQQMVAGAPVFGGVFRVHANRANELTSINGVFIPDVAVNTTPNYTVREINLIALDIVVAQPYSDAEHGKGASFTAFDLEIAGTTLYVYRAGLLEGVVGLNHLVYEVEIRSGVNLREFLYIDAHTGKVVERYSAIHDALFRRLYEVDLGSEIWTEGDPFPGGLDQWQQNEVVAAGHSYYLYFNTFGGYDSYDNAGSEMRTINNDPGIACPNANWNGATANYCTGTATDDVVSHEWGHAYTEYTSGLIYAWQSGALNESYSDIWGETVDLLNGYEDADDDHSLRTGCGSSDRWRMGEDATAFGGAIRDMWDPTCDGDPGKVTDGQYVCTTGDSGGVHSNSGIPNHAYALMVDGGTYNGQTITALGFTKAAHIHWRAQSMYETPTTDFAAHADALEQACADLMGVNLEGISTSSTPAGLSGEIITAPDCVEVTEVILAVEFRLEACPGTFAPMLAASAPDLCSAGTVVDSYLSEDFETGLGAWTVSQIPSNPGTWNARDWTVTSSLPDGRAGSGVYGPDPVVGDCNTDLDNGIIRLESPVVTIPAATVAPIKMAFDHYASMEFQWDGGNLKYSVNGGGWTLMPASAFTFNGYNDALQTAGAGNDNPLAGEDAFTGADGGSVAGSWGQSQLDLSSIGVNPGDTVQLRWEIGSDGCNGWDGWYVDDVEVYSCALVCTAPTDVPWLSVAPTSGTTIPSGANSVTVTFDSTGLALGDYNANLCITSNDPDSSLIGVPVSMTVTGCSSPVAPSVISAGISGSDVTLTWTDTGDTQYEIWWSTDPYFMPGDAGSVQNILTGPFGASVMWTHLGAVGDPAINYYYVVTNGCGVVAPSTDRDAEFDFSIVSGT